MLLFGCSKYLKLLWGSFIWLVWEDGFLCLFNGLVVKCGKYLFINLVSMGEGLWNVLVE